MAISERNLQPGTLLVATYKGVRYTCLVGDGIFELEDGRTFMSPSAAGRAVMPGTACNGWRFWTIANQGAGAGQSAPKTSSPDVEGMDPGDDPLDLEPNKRAITTNSADPEIDSLYGKWKRGKLILQADFQRQFVWDRAKASRLIESALLAVPLPIIYLAQESDGRESVIDGQQRLTSFFSFLDGALPGGQSFRLSNLKVFTELNGKSFAELEQEQQDKVRYHNLRTITIVADSNPDLRFEIFERLNTGAVPLNDMELRNCIYRGSYMVVLRDMANDPEFKRLTGFKTPDQRMRDIELVLRFASFYHATYLKYQGPMKRFFNRDMEQFRNISDRDASDLQHAFKNGLSIVRLLFGDNAFRRFVRGKDSRPGGSWETKFNASLYDVLMGVFAEIDKTRVMPSLDSLREGLLDLMTTDDGFIDAILLGTSDTLRVRRRFDLTRRTVEAALEDHQSQPRCFSFKLKRELFDRDQTCGLCGQNIQQIDDGAVDHVQQYWRGGRTISENARLAHRYCNMARPRND